MGLEGITGFLPQDSTKANAAIATLSYRAVVRSTKIHVKDFEHLEGEKTLYSYTVLFDAT